MNVMANDMSRLVSSARSFLQRDQKLLIDGEWVDSAGGDTFDVIDPSSGEAVAKVPRGNAEDIDRAVRAATAALNDPAWRDMQPSDRERLMHRFADVIEAHAEELGQMEALDVGMPSLIGQHAEVGNVLATLRYMAGWPTKITGDTINIGEALPEKRFFAYTAREPVGVVGAIVPWNVPLMIAMWKIAPALAAGCTIILKPSEVTPLGALRLGELALDAGVPPGVINIVTGFGAEAGEALVAHPGVAKISFTGSVATGKAINKLATDTLKNVTLELGGKSPVVMLDDADVDKAARRLPAASSAIPARFAWRGRGSTYRAASSTGPWSGWPRKRAR